MVKKYLPSRRLGLDPWVRKIPWKRKWQPTPVFLPGKSHGYWSLAGYSRGMAKSRTRLSRHAHVYVKTWSSADTSFYTGSVNLRDGCVPACGLNVNCKTLLCSGQSSGVSVDQRTREIRRMSSDRSASVIIASWGWQGATWEGRSRLYVPAWAREQMAGLTAVYLAQLSLWSEPSCQVGSSCVWERGSWLGRNFRPLDVWSPHVSTFGNPYPH